MKPFTRLLTALCLVIAIVVAGCQTLSLEGAHVVYTSVRDSCWFTVVLPSGMAYRAPMPEAFCRRVGVAGSIQIGLTLDAPVVTADSGLVTPQREGTRLCLPEP